MSFEKVAERLLLKESGGRVLRPAGNHDLALAYVRPRPSGGTPLVLLPGGPGICSVVLYRSLRRLAAKRGLDVIMMEHRGVGLSRLRVDGVELATSDVTVESAADDLAAVLDAVGVHRAVIYGTSYGTYLAQAFGVRHPERVGGMVLDSPMLSAADDVAVTRMFRRDLLWKGPGRPAALFRELLDRQVVPVAEAGHVVQVVYEFAGSDVLERLLAARLDGKAVRTWNRIAALGSGEVDGPGKRFIIEPDLVAGITYSQLGYGDAPDGLPLDPQDFFARGHAGAPPHFAGEPFDLPTELPRFAWPTAVISGDRDLRTPRPIAEQIVGLIPDAVLVPLRDTGHSAMDTHQLAALNVARIVATGGLHRLLALVTRINALPRRGASRMVGPAIRTAVTVDVALRSGRGHRSGGGPR